MAVITICSDFGSTQNKSVTVSIVSPSICHEMMALDAVILIAIVTNYNTLNRLKQMLSCNSKG